MGKRIKKCNNGSRGDGVLTKPTSTLLASVPLMPLLTIAMQPAHPVSPAPSAQWVLLAVLNRHPPPHQKTFKPTIICAFKRLSITIHVGKITLIIDGLPHNSAGME